MRVTIHRKILGMFLLVTALTASAVFACAFYFVSEGFKQEGQENISRLSNIVRSRVDNVQKNLRIQTAQAAQSEAVVFALAASNKIKLEEAADTMRRELRADLIVITDAEGRVVVRSQSVANDDILDSRTLVNRALEGHTSAGVVTGSAFPLSLSAGAPVYYFGLLIGTINIAVSLSDEQFIDTIKNDIGMEVSIFRDANRLMTTILDADGNRAVSSPVESEAVPEIVLKQGKEYNDQILMLGMPFQGAYWPIRDLDDEIVGMWFIGRPLSIQVAAERNIILFTLGAIACLMPFIILLSWIFTRAISRPLTRTTEYLTRVEAGDLEHPLDVRTNDEIGVLADGLRSMVSKLKDQIQEVRQQTAMAAEEARRATIAMAEAEQARQNADTARRQGVLEAAGRIEDVVGILSSTAQSFASQNAQVERSAQQQNEKVTSSATAMEELTSTIHEIAHNAEDAAKRSDKAMRQAQEGVDTIAKAVESMDIVKNDTNLLQTEMQTLTQKTEAIGSVMNVINDIADQTNLLALNAAIEAARAGDAGRGFAVVADEVRKLAEKTVQATQEVGQAIKGIREGVQRSTSAMDNATGTIEVLVEHSLNSGQVLASILKESESAAGQVRTIANAVEQQTAVSNEISRALNDINLMTTQSAESMGHSVRHTRELALQAERLENLVQEMRTNE